MPPDIHSRFEDDENFEIGMSLLWAKHSYAVPELMQHMALYFVQFRPRWPGTILYSALAREVKKYGVSGQLLLSTLNYECLLEHAINSEGMAVNYGDFPAPIDEITVWKLHGSCNFLPVGVRATRAVRFSRDVIFGTEIRPTGDLNEVVQFCLGDNALPPVMCLFMPGKPTQVSPGSVTAMQEAWRSVVGTAEKLAIVGVRPNPADAHLWDAVAETPARVLFIGNEEAFSGWAKVRRRGESKVLASRFHEGFDSLIEEVVKE